MNKMKNNCNKKMKWINIKWEIELNRYNKIDRRQMIDKQTITMVMILN